MVNSADPRGAVLRKRKNEGEEEDRGRKNEGEEEDGWEEEDKVCLFLPNSYIINCYNFF